MPQHWTVCPPYELTTHSGRNDSAEIERPRRSSAWPTATLANWWNDRRRQRRIDSFTGDTAQLFNEIALAAGDQIFLPTVSELDFLGLAQFLARDARTRCAIGTCNSTARSTTGVSRTTRVRMSGRHDCGGYTSKQLGSPRTSAVSLHDDRSTDGPAQSARQFVVSNAAVPGQPGFANWAQRPFRQSSRSPPRRLPR